MNFMFHALIFKCVILFFSSCLNIEFNFDIHIEDNVEIATKLLYGLIFI